MLESCLQRLLYHWKKSADGGVYAQHGGEEENEEHTPAPQTAALLATPTFSIACRRRAAQNNLLQTVLTQSLLFVYPADVYTSVADWAAHLATSGTCHEGASTALAKACHFPSRPALRTSTVAAKSLAVGQVSWLVTLLLTPMLQVYWNVLHPCCRMAKQAVVKIFWLCVCLKFRPATSSAALTGIFAGAAFPHVGSLSSSWCFHQACSILRTP